MKQFSDWYTHGHVVCFANLISDINWVFTVVGIELLLINQWFILRVHENYCQFGEWAVIGVSIIGDTKITSVLLLI